MVNSNILTVRENYCCNVWSISIRGGLLILLFLLHLKSVSAQVDSLTVQYSLNARGTFKEGQLNQTILSLDAYYGLSTQHWKTEFFSTYKYLKTNGRLGENELFGRVLLSILPEKRLFPAIGYIYNNSEFYQIQRRHIPGIGIGYKLLTNHLNTIRFHAWAAYDHTEFKNISGYRTFRLNTFLSGNHKLIPDKLSLQYVMYYFQSLEEGNNYIWRIEPSLSVHISRNFSLTISIESHYEKITDSIITNRNSEMTVGIKYQNN